MLKPSAEDQRIRGQLRANGLKVTSARLRVLAALLEAECALTHAELDRKMLPSVESHGAEDRTAEDSGMDRVTLYRVLDDLVRHGLARRVAGTDRVWRFGAAAGRCGRPAQFECSACGTVLLLDGAESARERDAGRISSALSTELAAAVPSGFRFEQIEVTVRGRCARCA